MHEVWELIDKNKYFFDYHTRVNSMTLHYQDFTHDDNHHFYVEQMNGNILVNRQIKPSSINPDFYEQDSVIHNLRTRLNHMSFVYEREGKSILDIRGISKIDRKTNEFLGIVIDGDVYSPKKLSKFSKKLSDEYTQQTGRQIDTVRLSSSYTGRLGYNGEEPFASAFARHANIDTIGFESDVIAARPYSKSLSMRNTSTINTQLSALKSPSIESVGMYSGQVRYSKEGSWVEANRGIQFSSRGRHVQLTSINEVVDFL